jgi:hypothetical protein
MLAYVISNWSFDGNCAATVRVRLPLSIRRYVYNEPYVFEWNVTECDDVTSHWRRVEIDYTK